MCWVISGYDWSYICPFYNLQQKREIRYISPLSVINQVSLSRGSKSKQSKHSNKNIFRIPRHSLLRNQIFSLISKGFYLSPSREIIRLMTLSAAFLGKFLKPPWLVLKSPPPGDFAISSLSILDACGSPGADLPKREPTDFVGSIWRNTTLFPVILIFSRFPLFSQLVLIPNGQRKGGVLQCLKIFFCFCQNISLR